MKFHIFNCVAQQNNRNCFLFAFLKSTTLLMPTIKLNLFGNSCELYQQWNTQFKIVAHKQFIQNENIGTEIEFVNKWICGAVFWYSFLNGSLSQFVQVILFS